MVWFFDKKRPKSGLGEQYGKNLSDKKGLIKTIGTELTCLKVHMYTFIIMSVRKNDSKFQNVLLPYWPTFKFGVIFTLQLTQYSKHACQ